MTINQKRMTYIIITIGLIGYFGFKFYMSQRATSGNAPPDFEGTRIDGTQFKLAELQGNYILLDFWGSWCGPCIRDNPKLVSLYEKYNDKSFDGNVKFEMVTVALEKSDNNWKRASERAGFTWQNQIVEVSQLLLLSPLAQKYGVTDIPAKFLIEPDGKVHANLSFEEIDQFLSSKAK